jgi:hypothetical protein
MADSALCDGRYRERVKKYYLYHQNDLQRDPSLVVFTSSYRTRHSARASCGAPCLRLSGNQTATTCSRAFAISAAVNGRSVDRLKHSESAKIQTWLHPLQFVDAVRGWFFGRIEVVVR